MSEHQLQNTATLTAEFQPDILATAAEATIADFVAWRDANPDLVASHIEANTRQIHAATNEHRPLARLARLLLPSREREFERVQTERQVGFFAIYNVGEVPPETMFDLFSRDTKLSTLIESSLDTCRAEGPSAFKEMVESALPDLKDTPEVVWLNDQMTRLHRVLPEQVLRAGAMGKVARTILGTLMIATYDTHHEDSEVRKGFLLERIRPAFVFGATYALIDDVLQDSDYLGSEKNKFHTMVLDGLRTGKVPELSDMPDHPLAEELRDLYAVLLDAFPFDENRHLYQAGEAMYLAQDRDSKLTEQAVAMNGLVRYYPDMLLKAAMSRVMANIVGRRQTPPDLYSRFTLNFINQMRDDLMDRPDDMAAGRITAFTCPEEYRDTNPLYDLFAYDAYIAHKVFAGDPVAEDILTRFNAYRLAVHFVASPGSAEDLLQNFNPTPEIEEFIRVASRVNPKLPAFLQRTDTAFAKFVNKQMSKRSAGQTDPRIFVTDRLSYIDDVIQRGNEMTDGGKLNEIIDYVLRSGGKRLRPALSLMLAESLNIKPGAVEPLMRAVEFYHTSSLIFDDLPAQDNATTRRGRPTAHLAFDEAGAQLTGISLLSLGFGALSELGNYYPADRVNEVIKYFGSVLGPEKLCKGQYLDLQMNRHEDGVSGEAILDMYSLKTSSVIEAALVPLMTLEGRPKSEIEDMKLFAHHAGIVFQIRDDILDATSSQALLGKDVDQDIDKASTVRVYGLDHAQQLMESHLRQAVEACQRLPFDTMLLQGIVGHFATRRK